MRWYLSDRQRMAEVEAMVIENNVTEFVLGKAKVNRQGAAVRRTDDGLMLRAHAVSARMVVPIGAAHAGEPAMRAT